jgi:hypothetical protein
MLDTISSSVKVTDVANASSSKKGKRSKSFFGKTMLAFARSSSSTSCDSSLSGESSTRTVDTSSRSMKSDKKCKRKVRFNISRSHHKVYKIEPLFDYAAELWWSKEDIERCQLEQADFRSASKVVQANVYAYMRTFLKARHQVFHSDKDQPSLTVSAAVYKDLVLGRSQGFAGLELYINTLQANRRKHTSVTVASVVEASYECKIAALVGESTEERVRKYSRSLTAADRYWAKVMGNADSIAAQCITITIWTLSKSRKLNRHP